jgi:hypothetical protein
MRFFLTLIRKLVTTNSVKQVLVVRAAAETHLVELGGSATFSRLSLVDHHHLVAVNADRVGHRVDKTLKQLRTSHLKKRFSDARQR